MVINLQRAGAANADLAHLPRDQRRVRTHAAFGGQDPFGGNHAAQVFRRGFVANQQYFLALGGGGGRAVGIQINFAGSRAGSGGQSFGDAFGRLDRLAIKHGRKHLVQLVGRHAPDGCFPINQFFLLHLDGKAHRGEAGPFAVTGLEHEDFAVLDGEFEILHVLEMRFQGLANVFQLAERGGHVVGQLRHRFGRADAGHDIFALRVDEEFAVENLFAGRRVACECHAGAGIFTGIAIDHGLNVDGGAPFGGDAVFAAINDGAVVHPGAKHGADGTPKLLPRVLRKFAAGAFLDQILETDDKFLQIFYGEFGVFNVIVVTLVFEAMDDDFKRFMVFIGAFLHAHDHVAVHLDEPAVTIPGEPLVLRGLDQRQHGFIVEAEVQNRVHHAGHRIAGAGPDGDQQRHGGLIAEFGAHDFLDLGDAGFHHRRQCLGIGLFVGVIIGADLGGDGKARGHRQSDAGHFGEVRAFAAQQRLHSAVAVGRLVSKQIYVF